MNATVTELKVSQVFQVPYWDVENLWDKCGPLLDKAIQKQDYWTLEGVKNLILASPVNPLTNQMQLWYCPNKYAVVTQIQVSGTGTRSCLLFLCGGEDLTAIVSSLDIIGPWAKKHFGCTRFNIVGREGWLEVLKERGFKKKETIMEGPL